MKPRITLPSVRPSTGFSEVAGCTKWLAWSGSAAPLEHTRKALNAWVVYVFNLETRQEQRLYNSKYGERGQIMPLQINNRWVVWTDYLVEGQQLVDWTLEAYDLENAAQFRLAAHCEGATNPNWPTLPEFDLNQNRVIWTAMESRNGKNLAYLVLYDLVNRAVISSLRPFNETADILSPRLDKNQIIWQEWELVKRLGFARPVSSIILSNLDGSQRSKLNRTNRIKDLAFQPVVWGNYAAWKTAPGLFDCGKIVLHQINTGEQWRLLDKPIADQPVLNEHGVSWNLQSLAEIQFYDLNNGQISNLSRSLCGKVFSGSNLLGWVWNSCFSTEPSIAIELVRWE